METAFMILLFVLAFIFYFLPTFIAGRRDTKNQNAILVVNLLFGWTILGWIAALIWAIIEEPEDSYACIGAGSRRPR